MVDLEIIIPRKIGRLKLWPKRIRRKIPENYDELTAQDMLALLSPELLEAQGTSFYIILLCERLLGISKWDYYVLNTVQLAQITLELRWLEYPEEYPLRNFFPSLRVRQGIQKIELFGPGDNFKGLRLGAFTAADQYYLAWYETGYPEHLDYLVALLYERNREDEFYMPSVENRLPLIKKIAPLKKQAVLHYFSCCRRALSDQYPLLFSGAGNAASDRADGEPSSDWLDFIRHLPSDKFGDLSALEQKYVHPVFDIANRMMRDAQQIRQNQR